MILHETQFIPSRGIISAARLPTSFTSTGTYDTISLLDFLYRYISSNGRVSRKQDSQTSLTILPACSWSLTPGLAIMDNVARRRTHACSCSVMVHWLRVKNSRENLHSPLSVDARIYDTSKPTENMDAAGPAHDRPPSKLGAAGFLPRLSTSSGPRHEPSHAP